MAESDSSAAAIASMPGFDGFPGQQKSSGLQLWGNRESMNLNSMVLTNIKQSPYFKHELIEMKTFHEVVDEIYYKVRGVGAGGIVSTAYCLLYKLFTLRISRKQLQTLLDHPDSPYIRGIGFMYIRYCLDPKDYWTWFEPYMDDPEEIDVKAGGGCHITIGEMLRQFLTQLDWYSTLFPRIPVPIEKDLRARLQERSTAAKQQQPNPSAAAAASADNDDNGRRSRSRERHHRHQRRSSRSRSRSRDDKDRDRDRDHRDDRHQRSKHHHHHRHHRDRDSRDR